MKLKDVPHMVNDKYSYYVTSPYCKDFEIIKLHMCSWAYEDSSECLEIGFQLKLKDGWTRSFKKTGETRDLPIFFWLPWIDGKDQETSEDLYFQISNKENAAFIFNDACPTATDCVETKSSEGQILVFSNRDTLTVLPLSFEAQEGKLCVKVHIPARYQNKHDVYARFCMKLPKSSFGLRYEAFSKETRIYNINLGQLRNMPKALNANEICSIRDIFVLHILPSKYLQTFTDRHAFKHIRFLEAEKYCRYAQNSKFLHNSISQDEMIVSFSKCSNGDSGLIKENSFYSVFERDCMGRKQVVSSIWINILCALLCAAITSIVGWFYGQKTSQGGVPGNTQGITNQVINCNHASAK